MSADAHGKLSAAGNAPAGGRLVIFGAGYVGGELARQALGRGMPVTILTRNKEKAQGLRSAGCSAIVADLAGKGWHELMPGDATIAVNCVSAGGGGVDGYRRSYLDGMNSVVAWAGGAGVGTLVYTSSTSVYAVGAEGRDAVVPVVDELSPAVGTDERSSILVESERRLMDSGIPRKVILRLAGIYGPGRHHLLDALRQGTTEFPGEGNQHLNLIHRDDAVSAIWAVLKCVPTPAAEIFNVSDGRPSTKAQVVQWLAEKLGVPSPRFVGGDDTGRRRAVRDRIISNEKLRSQAGWAPGFEDFRAGFAGALIQE